MYEWVRGTESLHAFGRRHKLGPARFMAVVRAMNWRGVREKLRAQAMEKAEKRIVADLTKRYVFQEKQWLTVEGIIARAIKRIASDADVASLSPELLESLTRTLERTLKARKLIHGEPTPETPGAPGSGPQAGVMTHSQVVQLIQAIGGRDPRYVIPESVIDAEMVEGQEQSAETTEKGGQEAELGPEEGGAE